MSIINKLIFFMLLAGTAVLAMLLLRENERAVSAEARVSGLASQMEKMRNEKGNAITDLEMRITELQTDLADAQLQYNRMFLEKSDELEKEKLLLSDTRERYEKFLTEKNSEIVKLEQTIRDEAKKSEDRLAKKNAEISELGSQLKDISANLSRVLKEKEEAEARIRQDERKLLDLEYALRRLELEKAQSQTQTLPQSGPAAKLAYD